MLRWWGRAIREGGQRKCCFQALWQAYLCSVCARVSIFVHVCLRLPVWLSLSAVCISVCLVCMCVGICVSVFVDLCLYVCLCLSIYVCVLVSVSGCMCLCVCLVFSLVKEKQQSESGIWNTFLDHGLLKIFKSQVLYTSLVVTAPLWSSLSGQVGFVKRKVNSALFWHYEVCTSKDKRCCLLD